MAVPGFISTWPDDAAYSDDFKHFLVVERQIKPWDIKNNRPIQNGQVQNLHTGLLEALSYDIGTFTGPPCVELIVTNINVSPALDGTDRIIFSRGAHIASMGEIVAEIGSHVREDLYEIVSLNATKFAVVLVVNTRKSRDEVAATLGEMRRKLIEATWERSKKLRDEALGNGDGSLLKDDDAEERKD
ncbi:hypothetical protein BKA61DRAFT_585059 [Leptodontidium sp. MPI-SDFR-AT-0119]|nr:hypothetical protein BKA61DRAFT_585059 [Leptodontidium sp. MPI-SDFR-AT-0119]